MLGGGNAVRLRRACPARHALRRLRACHPKLPPKIFLLARFYSTWPPRPRNKDVTEGGGNLRPWTFLNKGRSRGATRNGAQIAACRFSRHGDAIGSGKSRSLTFPPDARPLTPDPSRARSSLFSRRKKAARRSPPPSRLKSRGSPSTSSIPACSAGSFPC